MHSGAVIGSDGFGYAPTKAGWHKIPQLGSVRIGDRTEIGAGTTVDRGALDDTIIGNGVIIDNQVQIAHNDIIGDNTAIAGTTVLAGSVTIGKNCVIGGACAINGHMTICDGVTITGMSMVIKDIDKPRRLLVGHAVTNQSRVAQERCPATVSWTISPSACARWKSVSRTIRTPARAP